VTVNLELLVADLEQKIKARQLLPESPNLDADLRGIIASNQKPEPDKETAGKPAALTGPAASGNMGALQA
jgi:hypothetical protein